MLMLLGASFPQLLALYQSAVSDGGSLVHPPEGAAATVQILLRWLHLLAGIIWIGFLYFFNIVNVPLFKKLDGPTKGKVIPEMMPRALWWFRWGAVVTVLAGLMYFAMYILATDAHNANFSSWTALGIWLGIVVVVYVFIYGLLQPVKGIFNNGNALAVLIGIAVIAMAALHLMWLGRPGVSNKTLSIAIGGGLGVIMLLNVWGIIWPCQKRIIAWTKDNAENGTPIPAESATLARRAFLASRANFWLSIPMLFFMGTSSHYEIFGR
ncbi:MAG: urate hydroxylase PuuD [Acidobacteria bacterium]|nr:urate hydroxylase PuuD [Acidobacteriota bacterium]